MSIRFLVGIGSFQGIEIFRYFGLFTLKDSQSFFFGNLRFLSFLSSIYSNERPLDKGR